MPKVIIIPGNGYSSPRDHWYPYVQAELTQYGVRAVNVQFPDLPLARMQYWLPFIKQLGADEDTVLVGHSTGAIAAMRYAETKPILGLVLVAAYHTDFGIQEEKMSGYFDTPWNWEQIRSQQNFIVQFASTSDPFIPIAEAHYVRDKLKTDYHELTEGHFGGGSEVKTVFPELINALKPHFNL